MAKWTARQCQRSNKQGRGWNGLISYDISFNVVFAIRGRHKNLATTT